MFRGLVVVALILTVMVTIKDGRAFRETGLVASCSAVEAPIGQAGYWEACRAGKLEGRPNLGRRSCKSAGLVHNLEYWQCPSRLESGPG